MTVGAAGELLISLALLAFCVGQILVTYSFFFRVNSLELRQSSVCKYHARELNVLRTEQVGYFLGLLQYLQLTPPDNHGVSNNQQSFFVPQLVQPVNNTVNTKVPQHWSLHLSNKTFIDICFNGRIENDPALVWLKVYHRIGNKPLAAKSFDAVWRH